MGCGGVLLLLLELPELPELPEVLLPEESVFGAAGGAAAIAVCTLFIVLDG